MKTYFRQVKAIQWDGTKDKLEEIKNFYSGSPIVVTLESNNRLGFLDIRNNNKWLVPIGDYLIRGIGDDSCYMVKAEVFNKTYTEVMS